MKDYICYLSNPYMTETPAATNSATTAVIFMTFFRRIELVAAGMGDVVLISLMHSVGSKRLLPDAVEKW